MLCVNFVTCKFCNINFESINFVTEPYKKNQTGNGKQKMKAQAIFLNLFTVCSSCKWKFVVCPLVDEKTNGSYPFANALNDLPYAFDDFPPPILPGC